jgi:outer membrane protein assembly factor BamB
MEGWDYFGASPVLIPTANDRYTAIFGNGDGVVRSVDAGSGDAFWTFETATLIRGTPAVSEGLVFVGGGDGIVYALDLATGEERWRYVTAGTEMKAADFGFDRQQIQASPAVVDGVVYIGSRDASLYALDAANGDLLWHREDGSAWVVGSAAVAGGTLFNGRSSSRRFRAVDIVNGGERWVVKTGAPIFSSPVVVDDLVYVGSEDGRIYAFETETGATRWQYATDGAIYSSPVVADGRAYIGSDDGVLYAIDGGSYARRHLAVFFDDSLTSHARWGRAPHNQWATNYLQKHGYRVLDAEGLQEFMTDRANDGEPSVVVFGMDVVPETVASSAGDTALTHGYLGSGGKIVWLGRPPFFVEFDSTGKRLGVDRNRPSQFVGVDFSPWNGDRYYARPTEIGREWGLTQWETAHPSAISESVDVILARDELGSATAWVNSFGGPPGTGFVFLPEPTNEAQLDQIRSIAEYGLLRE